MSEQNAGEQRAAAAVDVMPMTGFQEVLRRSAQFFRPRTATADPLAETVKKIEQNPATNQSRLMTRILAGLTYQEGEFRIAEASSLDADTLFRAITLMDAYAAGTPAREEWIRAVASARAAQLAAGG